MAKIKNAVTVLSFEHKLVPSDGFMSGSNWETKENTTQLSVLKKSVRGTISNRIKKATIKNDPLKLNAEVEKANLQTIDYCTLDQEHDTLKVFFTLKVLGGIQEPSSCNNVEFKQAYQAAVQNYIKKEGFKELGRRYAYNLANARFLWRNKAGAKNIEVQVKDTIEGKSWVFNATQFSTRNFDCDDAQVKDLGDRIAGALASNDDFLMLEINCYANVGKAQDVYPSQELVLNKGEDTKGKVLYSVKGNAAMHSQKIGNALRSIDTWYSDFVDPEKTAGPIAIEPYGAVTNLGTAFRTPKSKQDFYTLFDAWARGATLDKVEEEHYVMATLVRGGVFGELK